MRWVFWKYGVFPYRYKKLRIVRCYGVVRLSLYVLIPTCFILTRLLTQVILHNACEIHPFLSDTKAQVVMFSIVIEEKKRAMDHTITLQTPLLISSLLLLKAFLTVAQPSSFHIHDGD